MERVTQWLDPSENGCNGQRIVLSKTLLLIYARVIALLCQHKTVFRMKTAMPQTHWTSNAKDRQNE